MLSSLPTQIKSKTKKLWPNRGHLWFGLETIFADMLYNVQIIQKSGTHNIMHVIIIVLKLPAKSLIK